MKIFDYSWKTGKGDVIGDVRFSGTGCRIGNHKGYRVHDNLETIEYVNGAPVWESVTADDFGAGEAVLFCTGSWECGDGKEKWEWFVVPTKALAEKAKVRNIKLYGHEHNKETNHE